LALSKTDWGKFILLGIIWGSSFMWIKIAVQESDPFMVVTLRLFFALLTLAAVIFVRRPKLAIRSHWKEFLFLGFFNNALPWVLIAWGESHTSSSMASILNSTSPLYTLLITPLFVPEERQNFGVRLVGTALGFLGVILIMLPDLQTGMVNQTQGQIAILLAVLCYAISITFARLKTVQLAPEMQAFGQTLFGFVLIAAATFVLQPGARLPVLPVTWFAAAWLGVLSTATAMVLYFSLLRSVGPVRTMVVSYILPVVGVILGFVFLSERPHPIFFAGSALILGAVFLVNSRRERYNRVYEQ